MAIGVSYFGNRILRHVAADMDDLAARGFTGVLHTFSENDFFYYRAQIAEIVRVSHDAGLTVQLAPWGLGHAFGGEAESLVTAQRPEIGQVLSDGRRIGAGCPSNRDFRAFVRRWGSAAVEAGADSVFWDEPHWAAPERFAVAPDRWGCRCGHCRRAFAEQVGGDMPDTLTAEVAAFRAAVLVGFVRELVADVHAQGGASTVCLLPVTEAPRGMGDWEPVAALPGLATLATDPYWQVFDQPVEPFVSAFADRVRRLADAHGIGAQIWIQGFGLGPQDADDIRTAVASARAAGVEDLWTWGYEACGHMPALGTREPQRVWAVLCEALAGGPRDRPAGG
ncbi:MAG: hypothetical protein WD080_12670 [Egibacteraceae bacterium]